MRDNCTPGPWLHVYSGSGESAMFSIRQLEPLGICLAEIERYPDETREDYTKDPQQLLTFWAMEANARLMAAAPELLECCRQAHAELPDGDIKNGLAAAINKATVAHQESGALGGAAPNAPRDG